MSASNLEKMEFLSAISAAGESISAISPLSMTITLQWKGVNRAGMENNPFLRSAYSLIGYSDETARDNKTDSLSSYL